MTVHEGKKREKPHKCTTCTSEFVSKRDLNRHVHIVHEGKKPHKCDTCDKAFTTKQTLTNHMKRSMTIKNIDQNWKSSDSSYDVDCTDFWQFLFFE